MSTAARRMGLGTALAVLFTACVPTIWDKPGTTQQDFATDSYSCERDARQSGYFGGGILGALNMRDFYERCLVAHGYRKRAQEGETPSAYAPPSRPTSVAPVANATPQRPPPSPMPTPGQYVRIQWSHNPSPLYLQPSLDAEQVGMLAAAVNLLVIEERGDWLSVQTPAGPQGWILRQWVLP